MSDAKQLGVAAPLNRPDGDGHGSALLEAMGSRRIQLEQPFLASNRSAATTGFEAATASSAASSSSAPAPAPSSMGTKVFGRLHSHPLLATTLAARLHPIREINLSSVECPTAGLFDVTGRLDGYTRLPAVACRDIATALADVPNLCAGYARLALCLLASIDFAFKTIVASLRDKPSIPERMRRDLIRIMIAHATVGFMTATGRLARWTHPATATTPSSDSRAETDRQVETLGWLLFPFEEFSRTTRGPYVYASTLAARMITLGGGDATTPSDDLLHRSAIARARELLSALPDQQRRAAQQATPLFVSTRGNPPAPTSAAAPASDDAPIPIGSLAEEYTFCVLSALFSLPRTSPSASFTPNRERGTLRWLFLDLLDGAASTRSRLDLLEAEVRGAGTAIARERSALFRVFPCTPHRYTRATLETFQHVLALHDPPIVLAETPASQSWARDDGLYFTVPPKLLEKLPAARPRGARYATPQGEPRIRPSDMQLPLLLSWPHFHTFASFLFKDHRGPFLDLNGRFALTVVKTGDQRVEFHSQAVADERLSLRKDRIPRYRTLPRAVAAAPPQRALKDQSIDAVRGHEPSPDPASRSDRPDDTKTVASPVPPAAVHADAPASSAAPPLSPNDARETAPLPLASTPTASAAHQPMRKPRTLRTRAQLKNTRTGTSYCDLNGTVADGQALSAAITTGQLLLAIDLAIEAWRRYFRPPVRERSSSASVSGPTSATSTSASTSAKRARRASPPRVPAPEEKGATSSSSTRLETQSPSLARPERVEPTLLHAFDTAKTALAATPGNSRILRPSIHGFAPETLQLSKASTRVVLGLAQEAHCYLPRAAPFYRLVELIAADRLGSNEKRETGFAARLFALMLPTMPFFFAFSDARISTDVRRLFSTSAPAVAAPIGHAPLATATTGPHARTSGKKRKTSDPPPGPAATSLSASFDVFSTETKETTAQRYVQLLKMPFRVRLMTLLVEAFPRLLQSSNSNIGRSDLVISEDFIFAQKLYDALAAPVLASRALLVCPVFLPGFNRAPSELLYGPSEDAFGDARVTSFGTLIETDLECAQRKMEAFAAAGRPLSSSSPAPPRAPELHLFAPAPPSHLLSLPHPPYSLIDGMFGDVATVSPSSVSSVSSASSSSSPSSSALPNAQARGPHDSRTRRVLDPFALLHLHCTALLGSASATSSSSSSFLVRILPVPRAHLDAVSSSIATRKTSGFYSSPLLSSDYPDIGLFHTDVRGPRLTLSPLEWAILHDVTMHPRAHWRALRDPTSATDCSRWIGLVTALRLIFARPLDALLVAWRLCTDERAGSASRRISSALVFGRVLLDACSHLMSTHSPRGGTRGDRVAAPSQAPSASAAPLFAPLARYFARARHPFLRVHDFSLLDLGRHQMGNAVWSMVRSPVGLTLARNSIEVLRAFLEQSRRPLGSGITAVEPGQRDGLASARDPHAPAALAPARLFVRLLLANHPRPDPALIRLERRVALWFAYPDLTDLHEASWNAFSAEVDVRARGVDPRKRRVEILSLVGSFFSHAPRNMTPDDPFVDDILSILDARPLVLL